MNNFNTVFKTIKDNSVNGVVSRDCFEKLEVALSERKSVMSIDFYLRALRDLQLIQYADGLKIIQLTEKGKRTNELFP